MSVSKFSKMSSWTDEEIMKLVEIWGEDAIQVQLEGCKHNKEVYTKISKEMKEAGHNRSLEQCRDKIRKLRSEYRKVKSKQEIIVVCGNT